MKKVFQNYWAIVTIATLIVALDQWTKWLVRTNIPAGQTWLPESLQWLSPYARIVHWYNTGAAFGIFQEGSMVFTVLAFIVIRCHHLLLSSGSTQDWPLRLAMSMQLGGAIGNLIDRLTIGHVTDFISVGTFPVFNIADCEHQRGLCGAYCWVCGGRNATRKRKKCRQSASDQPSEATSE